jgi:sporulation protein YqfC
MQNKKFKHIIADVFDVPLEGIANVPNLQLLGNSVLNIDGCIGIKKYEEDEISVSSKNFIMSVYGKELSMLTFSQGRVNIRGIITDIKISLKEK